MSRWMRWPRAAPPSQPPCASRRYVGCSAELRQWRSNPAAQLHPHGLYTGLSGLQGGGNARAAFSSLLVSTPQQLFVSSSFNWTAMFPATVIRHVELFVEATYSPPPPLSPPPPPSPPPPRPPPSPPPSPPSPPPVAPVSPYPPEPAPPLPPPPDYPAPAPPGTPPPSPPPSPPPFTSSDQGTLRLTLTGVALGVVLISGCLFGAYLLYLRRHREYGRAIQVYQVTIPVWPLCCFSRHECFSFSSAC